MQRTLVDVKEVAKVCGVSEITIRRNTKNGKLPHHRIGDRILYSESDIQSFLDSCAVSATQEAAK